MNEPNKSTEEIEPIVESEGEVDKKVDTSAPPSVNNGDDNAVTETTQDNRLHMQVGLDAPWSARMWEVFTTFWPLGFIAFGGPQVRYANLV